MRWSGVRKRVESRFADSVRGRVHLYSTRYECSCGRGWITVDGEEIANLCTFSSWTRHRAIFHETSSTRCARHRAVEDRERTPRLLVERGEFSRFDLHLACWDFLHLKLPEALASENPLIVSLAVLDARTGRRKLETLRREALHPLTRALLEFRLAIEGGAVIKLPESES
jgi:hypothetical protein